MINFDLFNKIIRGGLIIAYIPLLYIVATKLLPDIKKVFEFLLGKRDAEDVL
jgi:hypothetical protein